MTITKEQMETMQRLWIERSTQWEQGAEGPAATDRGSFKCGFLDGIRYAEAEQVQKVQQLEDKLVVAVEALELSCYCDWGSVKTCAPCEALAKIRGEA